MNKNLRLFILVVVALCFTFMYLSQTLLGSIADLPLAHTNAIFRNIRNGRNPKYFQIHFNNSIVSSSFSSCSKGQDKARVRIDKYCDTRSTNWTKRHSIQFPGATLITEKKDLLAYCHVPKAASTSWMLTFADMNLVPLNDILRFYKSMQLHDHLYNHFSIKLNHTKDKEENLLKLYKFIFLRHPFERIVSAFHDKFISIKQVNLMRPFIDYYTRLKGKKKMPKMPRAMQIKWIEKNVDVSFKNFIDFVLYESNQQSQISGPSGHWWPYTDMCKLCETRYDYIGKIETLKDDVRCILDQFPDYKSLHRMESRIKKKVNAKGHHSKDMTLEYFSKLPRQKVIELYKMYEDDFAIGGYDYPQKYIDVSLKS